MYVAPRCYAPKLLDLWVVAGVLSSLTCVFAPRLWRGVTWLVPWWGGGCRFCLVSPSLAWRVARRGFRRICREGVCFTPVGCFVVLVWFVVCCGGLFGAVAVVFVCCLAWAVFDVPGCPRL